MKKLIDNQTIAFDVHKAGDRQAVDLSGLHMHKRMNGRKFRGVNVIVPLDEKQELVFRPANTKESVRTHIVNEITRELNRDLTKRRKFVETVTSQIERYSDAVGRSVNSNQTRSRKNSRFFFKELLDKRRDEAVNRTTTGNDYHQTQEGWRRLLLR